MPELPASATAQLQQFRGKYSDIVSIFHVVCCYENCYAGVAGDGDNGAYEWFFWDGHRMEISDCGYGCSEWALRDVLTKFVK